MARCDEPLSKTTSLCPKCLKPVPGRYLAVEEAVYLERDCPEHGTVSRKVWDSVEHWKWADGRGPEPNPRGEMTVENNHACLAVIEVTQQCNLSCSYCFASSGPDGHHRSQEDIIQLLEAVQQGGGPRPIQFSGGEPTVRDDLPYLVETAGDMGFSHIQVNTNGIVLAQNDGYAERLVEAGVSAVYLQFDGLEAETYRTIREVDLTETKHAAIEACREAGLPIVLVPTIVPGVNDHEMGAIVEFAVQNLDVIRSINFQPIAHFGRFAKNEGRFSLDAAAGRLAEQIDSIEPRDLLPVPCCSGHCQSGTILIPDGNGGVAPVTNFLDREIAAAVLRSVDEAEWLEFMVGTGKASDGVTSVANRCGIDLAGGGCCGPGEVMFGDCCGGGSQNQEVGISIGGDDSLLDGLFESVLPVSLTGFMDADSADRGRLDNCCIAVPTSDGELAPFCGYNMTTESGEYALRNRHGWGGRRSVKGEPSGPSGRESVQNNTPTPPEGADD